MECGVGMELELDHTQEHFVKEVQIEGDNVTIVCSCGQSFGPKETEVEAHQDYNTHYESVME